MSVEVAAEVDDLDTFYDHMAAKGHYHGHAVMGLRWHLERRGSRSSRPVIGTTISR